MSDLALWLVLALAAVVAVGVLVALVASGRLTWRRALEWGAGVLVALGGVELLLGRGRPVPPPRAPVEPDRRLVERITGQALEEREEARAEREDLDVQPEAPVAGRLSAVLGARPAPGAPGATRRRRPGGQP